MCAMRNSPKLPIPFIYNKFPKFPTITKLKPVITQHITRHTKIFPKSSQISSQIKLISSQLIAPAVKKLPPVRILNRAWQAYEHQIRVANPVKAKIITAFFLFSAGDLTCQKILSKDADKPWDKKRTLLQGLIGACFMNPTCQFFYINVAHKIQGARTFGLLRNAVTSELKYYGLGRNAVTSERNLT
jgi:hypothetical protein